MGESYIFHIVQSSCYFLESKAPTEWILNGSCSLCGIGNARFDWSFSEEDNQIYDMFWMNLGARQHFFIAKLMKSIRYWLKIDMNVGTRQQLLIYSKVNEINHILT